MFLFIGRNLDVRKPYEGALIALQLQRTGAPTSTRWSFDAKSPGRIRDTMMPTFASFVSSRFQGGASRDARRRPRIVVRARRKRTFAARGTAAANEPTRRAPTWRLVICMSSSKKIRRCHEKITPLACCKKSPHIAAGGRTAAVFVLITRHTPRGRVRVLRRIAKVARDIRCAQSLCAH